MTNAGRLDALALLTGGQKQAVENHHLVPKVVFALIYPEKNTSQVIVVNDNWGLLRIN